MLIERMKPLMLAGIAGVFSTMILVSGTQAQEAPKKAAPEQEQTKPVEETKPSEQTQDASDGVTVPDYRDDRSTPQALMESYYNAINRKEYARAYSYYSEEGREPDFKVFVKGYEKTKSVKVAVRKTDPDPGQGRFTGVFRLQSDPKAMMARRKFIPAAIQFALPIPVCRKSHHISPCRL